MAFDTNNSAMYGFDGSGDVLTITLTNPNSTTLLVAGTGVQFLGATMQTAATPEPAALSLFGSGLLLMSMTHVRSKRNFRSSRAARNCGRFKSLSIWEGEPRKL
jgi:hypothetical protein